MDPLIGTRNCPHLGYDSQDSLPCCHADEGVRTACGKAMPNPMAIGKPEALGLAAYYCSALGKDILPAEAIRLAAELKAEAARGRQQGRPHGFQPPGFVSGRSESKPSREPDLDADQPVIPTHTLTNETQRPRPNAPCPCGSGRKYKKCCGRQGA